MEFKPLKITVLTETHTFAATDESVRKAENNKTFVYVQQKMNWADAR